jgi:hypothetical protein
VNKVTANPGHSQYLLDIAKRLGVDPHRVHCVLKLREGGGFLIDVGVDGKDLTGPQIRIVMEYLEEAFRVDPLAVG